MWIFIEKHTKAATATKQKRVPSFFHRFEISTLLIIYQNLNYTILLSHALVLPSKQYKVVYLYIHIQTVSFLFVVSLLYTCVFSLENLLRI
jgi:hypothetical protein